MARQAVNKVTAGTRARPAGIPGAEQPSESVPTVFVQDEVDHDLRHRMIREAAYQLYAQRGYTDGFELADWLSAEAEVDHLLSNRTPMN